jgi:hypothetical protein
MKVKQRWSFLPTLHSSSMWLLFFSFKMGTRLGIFLVHSFMKDYQEIARQVLERGLRTCMATSWQFLSSFWMFLYIYIPDMAKLRPNPLGKVKSVWNKKWGRCKYLMSETSWQEKKRQDHYVHAVEGQWWQWIMTHIYTSVSSQSPRKSRGSFPALSAPDDWFLFSDL